MNKQMDSRYWQCKCV